MMKMKKICALLLAAMLCVCMLAACSGEKAAPAGDPTYKVTVMDAMGNPVTEGVVVKFMQGTTQAGMNVVNENGVVEKALPAGEYTVELQFTGDTTYKYDTENLTLSADQTELTVTLSVGLGDKTQSISAGGKNYEAHFLSVGGTEISLGADRSYFLFAPAESGTYEFSLTGSDAAIGYYGAPHFVQDQSAAEVVDNKFTVSVRPDMIGSGNSGTTVLVIGVDAGEGTAVLGVERIGEHEHTLTDEPWINYQATHTPEAYTLPAGAQVAEFDLTAATDTYKLVVDANGFYHLDSENGPLVLVRLGKNAKVKYLDPYETVLEHTGINCYFYKDAEKKEFDRKENYADCVASYIACVDKDSGLYPLTEDLKYIIQNNGNHQGWWDLEGNYIFRDDLGNNLMDINAEIAWLFMCCYIQ